jgi:hypothetical protein
MLPPRKVIVPDNPDLQRTLNNLFEDLYRRALKFGVKEAGLSIWCTDPFPSSSSLS